MIPPSQLLDRYPETIGYRDQRIAVTHGVALRIHARHTRDWNHKFIVGVHASIRGQPVDARDIASVGAQRGSNAIQRLSAPHHMETPGRPLILRNLLDAL